MKIKILLIVALALCLTGSMAFADTLISATPAVDDFRSFTAANVNVNGAPYWDNNSFDVVNGNVGFFITKTGAFTANAQSPALASPQFWGGAYSSATDTPGTGIADPNFSFTHPGGTDNASVLLTLAGNLAGNVFGWYDATTNPQVAANRHILFGPGGVPGTVGNSASFNPTATYGYFLIGVDGFVWATQASKSSEGANQQHFAVFRAAGDTTGTFYIGAEDLPFFAEDGGALTGYTPISDRDFNDIVVKVQTSVVPLPGALLLLGGGLVRLVAYGRRRKNAA